MIDKGGWTRGHLVVYIINVQVASFWRSSVTTYKIDIIDKVFFWCQMLDVDFRLTFDI